MVGRYWDWRWSGGREGCRGGREGSIVLVVWVVPEEALLGVLEGDTAL